MKYLYKLLIILSCLFLQVQVGSSQPVYTFEEIKENLLNESPDSGDFTIRKNSLISLDHHIIFAPYPPMDPLVEDFYSSMIKKTLLEIEEEQVTEGATIWQIYNHGFVVKTPTICIGFDLMDFFFMDEFIEFAELVDIYFISHEHGDHYSEIVAKKMISLGKPVIGPGESSNLTDNDIINYELDMGESLEISGLSVTAHYGLHSIPVRQYEVITQEGIKILHTGDNQTSETLPEISGVDILLLNAWVNESGATSHIEGVRLAIDKIKPVLTLPGHICELGHLGGGYIVPYGDVFDSDNGTLESDYKVLGWGERYHYNKESNNTAISTLATTNDNIIEIYPNPFNKQASITIPECTRIRKLEFIDITGKTVISMENVSGPNINLNGHNLPGGIYILKILTGDVYFKKLVVE